MYCQLFPGFCQSADNFRRTYIFKNSSSSAPTLRMYLSHCQKSFPYTPLLAITVHYYCIQIISETWRGKKTTMDLSLLANGDNYY